MAYYFHTLVAACTTKEYNVIAFAQVAFANTVGACKRNGPNVFKRSRNIRPHE
jgi:hypothetical protein